MEKVILVDPYDTVIGTMEKLAAHQAGTLHRALSVFIVSNSGDLLLQQRAAGKYHSGGKWTNTCCSHPRPGELTHDAAVRRLREEMGLECRLTHAFSFTYRADVGNGLIEYELDHVFVGMSSGLPAPDPSEVQAYRYAGIADIAAELDERPETYTEWFKQCFSRVIEHLPVKQQKNACSY